MRDARPHLFMVGWAGPKGRRYLVAGTPTLFSSPPVIGVAVVINLLGEEYDTMNKPSIFSFESSCNIRAVMVDGNPWFVAADVCSARH
jgi:hypothetical protein